MLGPGDVGEIVKGAGEVARFVNDRVTKVEQGNLLKDWADLMKAADTEETAMEIRQYLTDRLQSRLFTPWYEEKVWIAVPKDMLTDAVDLLVGGPVRSRGLLAMILSALGVGGLKDNTKRLREWQEVIQTGHRASILDAFNAYLTDAGRVRQYDYADPSIPLDSDMVADIGTYLIQG